MKLTRKNINFLHHGHITRKYSYRLTSHLGDSGMKKSPTSRTAQGTNPAWNAALVSLDAGQHTCKYIVIPCIGRKKKYLLPTTTKERHERSAPIM